MSAAQGTRVMAEPANRIAAKPSSIDAAASWLATGGLDRAKPVVPQLQREFGLTPAQACEAIREAALVRARAH